MTCAQIEEMLTSKARVGVGGGQAGSSSGGGTSATAREQLPQDVLAEVASELEAVKKDVADGVVSYFKVRVLGGEWSMALFRKVTKDIGAYPKNQDVVRWCQTVGWPPGGSRNGVRSFAVSKYGVDGARHLADEMCRMGDYYMHSWVSGGCRTPFDFAPIKAADVSTREYVQWFEDVPLASPASRVAFEIRDFVPAPVPA